LRKTAIILTAQSHSVWKERKNKRKKERAYKPASAKVEHNRIHKGIQERKGIYTKKEPIKIDRLFIYL
jgi:hypothetical protein